jgi:hypothetical protein
MRIFQCLGCTNDRNGNPRRLTVEYDPTMGNPISIQSQGYSGTGIPEGDDVVILSGVQITPKEYRAWLRMAATL